MKRRLIFILGIGLSVAIVASSAIAVKYWMNVRWALPFKIDATTIDARQIDPWDGPGHSGADQTHGFHLIGQKVHVPPGIANELVTILNSPDTYTGRTQECFEPGLSLTIGQGTSQIDALICMECKKAVFYRGNQMVERVLSDEGNAKLLAVYHRLFEADPS